MAQRDRRAAINLWLSDYQYDFLLRFRSGPVTDFLINAQELLIERPVKWLLCRLFGHEPVPDQCNDPKHDFCVWCNQPMPAAALRDGSNQ